MSLLIRLIASVWIACFATIPLLADTPGGPPETRRQGPAGWDRIQFEGNETFTGKQLRNALIGEPDFLFAAHPKGPANDLGRQAVKLLTKGYREAGFLNPSIAIEQNSQALICRVDEGPRFLCGDVIVHGAENISAEDLVARLTEPYPGDGAFPTYVTANGVRQTRWVDKDGKSKDLEDAFWKTGKPVRFDIESKLGKQLSRAMTDLGFSGAVALTKILPNESSKSASLVIDIVNEGQPDRAEQIVCDGLNSHSRPELLTFLGLAEGDPVSREKIGQITQRLWQCGRFTKHQVHYDASSRRLQINVEETPGVPTIDEPIRDEAKTILAARRWLSQMDARGEDWEYFHHGKGLTVHAITSHQGMFVEISKRGAGQQQGQSILSFLVDDQGLLIDHSQHPGKLFIDTRGVDGQLTLTNGLGVSTDPDRIYALRLGIHVSSKRKADQQAICHELKLSPADWLPLAYEDDLEMENANGQLIVRYQGDELAIDRQTGRIARCVFEAGKVRFQAGLLADAKSRLTARTAAKENRFDKQHAATSVVAYCFSPAVLDPLAEEFLAADEENAVSIPPELIPVVRKLVDSRVLSAADALIPKIVAETSVVAKADRFHIPTSDSDVNSWQELIKLFAAKEVLHAAPQCFTEDSWPLLVTRESCLMLIGRGDYTGQVLKELFVNEDNGPLCHAVVAQLLARLGHPSASLFANRALAKLNAENFSRDWRAMAAMPGYDPLMESLFAIQSLSQDELDVLLSLSENESLNRLLRIVHSSQVRRPQESERFWYEIARGGLQASMEKLR